jgi:hypothetical protein
MGRGSRRGIFPAESLREQAGLPGSPEERDAPDDRPRTALDPQVAVRAVAGFGEKDIDPSGWFFKRRISFRTHAAGFSGGLGLRFGCYSFS